MKINFILLFFLFFIFSEECYPQDFQSELSVLFYNVENLFDTVNDPETNDDEFTPKGDRHWTNKRLNQKLLNLSKIILNASGWSVPGVIGLCEIENRNVLEKLIHNTPLQKIPYKIIHKESSDHRGIDVALIYNSDLIYPLNYEFYPLEKGAERLKTREILYFSGIVNEKDTLHFFVNHWPSRYDGLLETKLYRNLAAKLLKLKVEELIKTLDNPKIIVLGDFNDQPSDESISIYLDAQKLTDNLKPNCLYNLSYDWQDKIPGTIKYQSQWSVFDQIIVSGVLLNKLDRTFIEPENAGIIKSSFLLEKDEKYGGLKPQRTYNGFSYRGGFSDHLPVLLKLNLSN